DLKIDNLD
nr:Chain D, LEDGF peptide [Homo sapiens]3AVF_F Chain F, LEDGF peptide [Homo sapiens]